MIRLCLNCDTDNHADTVFCSECGMSLTRAPTGETAEEARSVGKTEEDPPGSIASSVVFQSIVKFFQNHPGVFLTVLYIQVSSVGVVYAWGLLREFELSIMDFAETNDFAVAALKQPGLLALSIICWIAAMFITYVTRRVVWRKSRRYRDDVGLRKTCDIYLTAGLSVLAVAAAVGLACYNSAEDARNIRLGGDPRVVVRLRSSDAEGIPHELEGETLLIATTGRYAFFYDRDGDQVQIVPVASILSVAPSNPTEVYPGLALRSVEETEVNHDTQIQR